MDKEWPSERVNFGGIFHQRNVNYSKETHEMMKSKLLLLNLFLISSAISSTSTYSSHERSQTDDAATQQDQLLPSSGLRSTTAWDADTSVAVGRVRVAAGSWDYGSIESCAKALVGHDYEVGSFWGGPVGFLFEPQWEKCQWIFQLQCASNREYASDVKKNSVIVRESRNFCIVNYLVVMRFRGHEISGFL